jgi:hypothetical protein
MAKILSAGRLVDGRLSDRGRGKAGGFGIAAGNLLQDLIHLRRGDVEIRDHRLRVRRGEVGRDGFWRWRLNNAVIDESHERRGHVTIDRQIPDRIPSWLKGWQSKQMT